MREANKKPNLDSAKSKSGFKQTKWKSIESKVVINHEGLWLKS